MHCSQGGFTQIRGRFRESMMLSKSCAWQLEEPDFSASYRAPHRGLLDVHLLPELRETPAHEVVGAWPGLRANIPQTNRFAGFLFDQRKFHAASGVSVDEFEGRPRGPGRSPLVPDLEHPLQ